MLKTLLNSFLIFIYLFIFLISSQSFGNAVFESAECSASLVKMKGMNKKKKALVLTAGHCIDGDGSFYEGGQLRPGTFWIYEKILLEDRIQIFDQSNVSHPFWFKKILFATMTGSDLALIELDKTYEEIEKRGDFWVYELSDQPVKVGQKFDVPAFSKGMVFHCQVESRIPILREKSWSTYGAIRLKNNKKNCRFFQGVSGSPLVGGDFRIYGVASTVYLNTGRECGPKNPCEISTKEKNRLKPQRKGQSYGAPVQNLYNCYNQKNGTFNFKSKKCLKTLLKYRAR